MRKGTKIFLFIGLGILAAGVIACFIAFACNGFHDLRFWKHQSASANNNKVMQSFEISMDGEFDNIEIGLVPEDLEIRKSTDGTSHAEYTGFAEKEDFTTYVKDGSFVFMRTSEAEDIKWTNLKDLTDYLWDHFGEDFDNLGEEGKLTIYLADKDYASLEINTVSGQTIIEPELSFTSVNVAAVSGDIKIAGIKNLNTLTASTTSGEISVSDSEIKEQITLSSVSGSLTVKNVTGCQKGNFATTSGETLLSESEILDVDAETTSGDLRLDMLTAEKLNASTVSGDVKGRVSADINVRANSTSGDISVPQGTVGNWSIETVSGDIHLDAN